MGWTLKSYVLYVRCETHDEHPISCSCDSRDFTRAARARANIHIRKATYKRIECKIENWQNEVREKRKNIEAHDDYMIIVKKIKVAAADL